MLCNLDHASKHSLVRKLTRLTDGISKNCTNLLIDGGKSSFQYGQVKTRVHFLLPPAPFLRMKEEKERKKNSKLMAKIAALLLDHWTRRWDFLSLNEHHSLIAKNVEFLKCFPYLMVWLGDRMKWLGAEEEIIVLLIKKNLKKGDRHETGLNKSNTRKLDSARISSDKSERLNRSDYLWIPLPDCW